MVGSQGLSVHRPSDHHASRLIPGPRKQMTRAVRPVRQLIGAFEYDMRRSLAVDEDGFGGVEYVSQVDTREESC